VSQPTLWDAPPWERYGHPFTREPLARSSDPETSREAAAAYLPHAKAQQAQIHAYLLGVGQRGATAREIATALGWTIEQVDRRMAEMRDGAMVSTRNGRDGPGCLPLERREGCCVHVARTVGAT
jgi:anthranilate phosphoribosyltransferase